ncbi:MAG TPA: TetR/AcrR family transcriptional regulator [Thermoleophilaceae bacterium]|jgi:AcrR family transcriptional regulator
MAKRAQASTEPQQQIRPPLQRRSQESLERVLTSGAELLLEVGYEGFTLQEVSKRSGVSIGSIYARAPSKEALILAIYDREFERVTAANERLRETAQLEGLKGRELVIALVQLMARITFEHADLLRVFMYRALVDPEIWRRGSERSMALSRAFEEALLDHKDEFSHPDPELAIDMTFRFVYNSLVRRVTHGENFESPRALSEEDLIRELGEAAADYLLAPQLPRQKRKPAKRR